jgi:phage/plasmid-associated DNA primase
MDKSVVVQGPKKTSGAHSTEICQLENSRLGILSETQESDVINDSQMKVLTGLTDTMSIREIYGRQKEMKPLFVPFISSNHKLQINLDDNAMFERLVLIPFRLSFINNPDPEIAWQRKGDEKLSEKFRANKEGILKWIVECSNFYHKTGDISLPQAVVNAKKSYKYEMDSYQQFVDEMIVVEVGAVCKLKDILPVYKDYVNSRLITCNLKKARTKLAFLLEKYSIQKETYAGIYVKEN